MGGMGRDGGGFSAEHRADTVREWGNGWSTVVEPKGVSFCENGVEEECSGRGGGSGKGAWVVARQSRGAAVWTTVQIIHFFIILKF